MLTLIPFLRGCFDKDFVQQPHPPRKDQENPPGSDTSTGDFPALFVNALISIILLSLLLRSSQRGQILFALFASFLLGTLAANHFFPRSRSIVSWIVPVLVGIVYYALAANTVGGSVEGWIDVPNYGYVLPIDWVTAGSAGSALGYWIIARMRELRGLQTEGEQKKQEP